MESGSTVFVVDGDAISRNAVCRLIGNMNLSSEPHASGQAFLDACCWERAGCLVTEVRVPDVSGLQIQQELARRGSPLPVIFLSAYATVDVVVKAMRAGALHFLEKPPNEQELWDAIQEAVRIYGHRRKTMEQADAVRRRLEVLGPEEMELLQQLPRHDSTRTIAEELAVSVRTVELRRARLMQKLNLESPVELLRFAIGLAETTSSRPGVVGGVERMPLGYQHQAALAAYFRPSLPKPVGI